MSDLVTGGLIGFSLAEVAVIVALGRLIANQAYINRLNQLSLPRDYGRALLAARADHRGDLNGC